MCEQNLGFSMHCYLVCTRSANRSAPDLSKLIMGNLMLDEAYTINIVLRARREKHIYCILSRKARGYRETSLGSKLTLLNFFFYSTVCDDTKDCRFLSLFSK